MDNEPKAIIEKIEAREKCLIMVSAHILPNKTREVTHKVRQNRFFVALSVSIQPKSGPNNQQEASTNRNHTNKKTHLRLMH